MLKSSLWDYIDAYTLVSGTAALAEIAADGRNNDIEAVFKNVVRSIFASAKQLIHKQIMLKTSIE